MRLGIIHKFALTLVLTAALPLMVGVAIIQIVGQRFYLEEKGSLYETSAAYTASRLSETINDQISHFSEWLDLSDIPSLMERQIKSRQLPTAEAYRADIDDMQRRWANFDVDSPELLSILRNDVARALRAYQAIHPLFVEIFVTDDKGRVLAASNKTTDYWQADEEWWRKAYHLATDRVWVEGIHYDESAEAYSLDVAIPLRRSHGPDNTSMGVVKGVMDASPLLASLSPVPGNDEVAYHVVTIEGKIMARLFGRFVEPYTTSIASEASSRIAQLEHGWQIARLNGTEEELVGFAPLTLTGKPVGSLVVSGTAPAYVIVHQKLSSVLAPLRRQLWLFAALAVVVVVVFVLASVLAVKRQVIAPLEVLRTAAHSISMTHGLQQISLGRGLPAHIVLTDETARSAVQEVDRIKTGDEVEKLAHEFRQMADHVLDYHEKKERENPS